MSAVRQQYLDVYPVFNAFCHSISVFCSIVGNLVSGFMKLLRSSLVIAIIRNVLFWLLIPYIHFRGKFWPEYFILVFALFIAYAAGYLNNYFLIPRFLMRRRYLWYILLIAAVIWANSYWAYLITHYVNHRFGNIDFQAVVNNESLYYFAIITIIVFILLTLGKFTSDAIINQRRLEELEKNKLESELGSLRSQVNPHFLFNALNTIYGMARRTDQDTAEAILKLSDILRHGLYECDHDFILLEKEVSLISDYIAFAKMRVHDKDCITMQVNVQKYRHRIAPLLLIPFVENAIKHGIGKHAANAHVQVCLSMVGDELFFTCTNSNYNKNIPVAPDNYMGIGLKNVRRRLELLYPKKHSLKICDNESTFTVELKMQLQPI